MPTARAGLNASATPFVCEDFGDVVASSDTLVFVMAAPVAKATAGKLFSIQHQS